MGITIGKILTVLAWMLSALNLASPFPGIADIILTDIGLFLLVAHTIECLIFTPIIKKAHENLIQGYALTFIFGFIYIYELRKHEGITEE